MRKKINWNEHIESWKTSGLSKVEYCRQNDLNKHTFYEVSRSKSSASDTLLQLPFHYEPVESDQQPILEIHLHIPFSFRLRLNIQAGKRL